VIQEEARRLSRLVDNLLDISRLEVPEPPSRGADRASVRRDDSARRSASSPRARMSSPSRSTASFAHQSRRGADGARVRQRARERSPPLGRPSRVGSSARGTQPGGDPERSSRPAGDRVIVRVVDRGSRHPTGAARARLRAVLPRRETRWRPSRVGARAPRSRAASRRPTRARCTSSRCTGQGAAFVFELPLRRLRHARTGCGGAGDR